MKAASLLKDGFTWPHDKWLNKGSLCHLIPFVDIHELSMRVRDVFYEGQWHLDTIYTHIPIDIQMIMRSLVLSDSTEDILIWGSATSGKYSSKSGYSWLISKDFPSPDPILSWAWVWKLRVPENLRHFIWQIMHGGLPCNVLRVHRHLTSDSSCQKCGAPQETILHMLRDCPTISNAWERLGFTLLPNFFVDDYGNWMQGFASQDRGIVFIVTCWVIWRARNQYVFEDIQWSIWTILNKIRTHHEAIMSAYGSSSFSRPVRQVQWCPPSGNAVKLNVDGSCIGNPGRSGYGGLLRNANGEWLLGFSGFCGVTTNTTSELFAIYVGLSLAWRNGYRDIVCETDSMMALNLIKDGVDLFHPHASILANIHKVMAQDWNVELIHTLREGNSCADWLAKNGASADNGVVILNSCPTQLAPLVLADAMGVVHLRA